MQPCTDKPHPFCNAEKNDSDEPRLLKDCRDKDEPRTNAPKIESCAPQRTERPRTCNEDPNETCSNREKNAADTKSGLFAADTRHRESDGKSHHVA